MTADELREMAERIDLTEEELAALEKEAVRKDKVSGSGSSGGPTGTATQPTVQMKARPAAVKLIVAYFGGGKSVSGAQGIQWRAVEPPPVAKKQKNV